MKTITGTASAWLSAGSHKEDPSEFDNLFLAQGDMTSLGWVKVGNATVTVELMDNSEIINSRIDALHADERRVMAETEKKLTDIRGQIQSLLAIEYKPEVAE